MTNGFLEKEEAEFSKFYNRSVWWVEHRALLGKIGIGIWIVIDVLLVLFSLWTFIETYAFGVGREHQAIVSLALDNQRNLRDFSRATAAEALRAESPLVFSGTEGRWDLYTSLSNPNDDWYAEFTYAFVWDGGEGEEQQGYILPGAMDMPFHRLAVESNTRPDDVAFQIRSIAWHRVDPHTIPDYPGWETERFTFDITDVSFTTDLEIDGEKIGRSIFTVRNRTSFSYWEPVFHVRLYRGDTVVGVTSTRLAEFGSGDTRTVSINWFGPLPAVSRVEVTPEVNLFDIDTYMPLTGETPDDVRLRISLPRR